MPRQDVALRTAERARRFDELAAFDRQRRRPHHAGEDRGVDDADRHDAGHHTRSLDRHDQQRQEDCREGQQHVHGAHQHAIPQMSPPGRKQPDDRPGGCRDGDRGEGDDERLADPQHQAAEGVAAEQVRAEPVGETGRLQPIDDELLQRIVRRQADRPQPGEDQKDQDDRRTDAAAGVPQHDLEQIHHLPPSRMRGSSAA